LGQRAGKICMYSCRASLQTFFIPFHCKARGKVSYEAALFFSNLKPLVSIYIAHKLHQNKKSLLQAFSVMIQKRPLIKRGT